MHQALFGVYLGITFAPNHKGMPHPDGTEDFLRKQVLTSRNVRGGWLVDTALGGLNYQIEHHLFPAMPTPNLRKAQPIVQAYCAELGVPYEATSLIDSYARRCGTCTTSAQSSGSRHASERHGVDARRLVGAGELDELGAVLVDVGVVARSDVVGVAGRDDLELAVGVPHRRPATQAVAPVRLLAGAVRESGEPALSAVGAPA